MKSYSQDVKNTTTTELFLACFFGSSVWFCSVKSGWNHSKHNTNSSVNSQPASQLHFSFPQKVLHFHKVSLVVRHSNMLIAALPPRETY